MTKHLKHENTAIPGCGFHHIAIRTGNWDASMKFWVDAMGFTPAANWGEAPKRAAGAEVTVEPKTLAPFPNQDFPVRLAFIKGPDGEICEFFQNDVL
jgi:glyoxylase I family protein